MHGRSRLVPGLLILFALGLVGVLLLPRIIPRLGRSGPTPTPTLQPTPTPVSGPSPAPGETAVVTRIGEEEMCSWLRGGQTRLGQGVEFAPTGLRIRSTGITVSGSVRVEQLQGMEMPVEILLKPVVSDRHLGVEVLDVRLGGAYSSFSGVVKPLVSAGIGEGLDVEQFLAQQGVCVSDVELHEGFMVVTTVPGAEP